MGAHPCNALHTHTHTKAQIGYLWMYTYNPNPIHAGTHSRLLAALIDQLGPQSGAVV